MSITVAKQENQIGCIYLIREREFIRLNENTFKIGRTQQKINSRMMDYPKDSEIILIRLAENYYRANSAI